MPGLNKTPEEWSNLEWAVNCTDICAQQGLEWSREQDGCIDLAVWGLVRAPDGSQAVNNDSGLGPDSLQTWRKLLFLHILDPVSPPPPIFWSLIVCR